MNIIELMKSHKSIRKFLNKEIDNELFLSIIEAGQMAPTSSFRQCYSIIRVNDKNIRKEIYKYSGEQPYILEAPEFLVFCPETARLKTACEINDKKMKGGFTESFIIATVDTALVAQNIMIAAESLGLGGVYIGAIRNNPDKISEILSLPNHIYPAFGMCLGYPDQNPDIKQRLPMSLVLHEDKYKETDIDILKKYDEEIKNYYIERTKGKIDDTWTKAMSDKASKELRPHMKGFLESKGFIIK